MSRKLPLQRKSAFALARGETHASVPALKPVSGGLALPGLTLTGNEDISLPISLALPGKAEVSLPYQAATPFNPGAQILGDSGSSEALRILLDAANHVKRKDTLALLKDAVAKFHEGDWAGGGEFALKALHVDEKCGEAWHILGISRDKCLDFKSALTCYETALRLMPEHPAIANDLGRLAFRMNMNDMAEKFFRFFLSKNPGHIEAINNICSALRELDRLDDAVSLLQEALAANPTSAQLWNVLGTVVNAQGDTRSAAIFYREAMTHAPNNVHAIYNLGNIEAAIGDGQEAVRLLKRALPMFNDPLSINSCKLSIGFCHLMLGEYEEGWKWYEVRGGQGTNEGIHCVINRPRWQKSDSLKGKRIFVSAEQGLGDEIMFGTLLPDLLEEIGPEGHLSIGVESRLVPLFQRALPEAKVVRHHTTKHQGHILRIFPDVTDWETYDHWALMGDFLGRYRNTLEAFRTDEPFFKPDPERVAYWRAILNGVNDKPKVGILWKSLIKHSRRDRFYSPFAQWETIMRTEGIQIVNLQYGDTSEELAWARDNGIDIWTPPGINLKNDLDDLSALSAAMDCILCPANATSNIAGAAGAPVWLIAPERSWNCLGTDYFPWYPSIRVFFSESLLDWTPVMGRIKDALVETFVDAR